MKRGTPYLFAAPALVFIGCFSLLPMAQIIYYSFLDYSFFGEHSFIGFDQYIRLVSDTDFWRTLLNSFVFVLVTPVLMFLSLVLALALRHQIRNGKILRLLLFLPVITPIVIAGIIWRWIFTEETGLANYFLSWISIGRIHWLTDYPANIISTMIVTVWRGMGYYMMLFLAGLAVIPRDIEDASRLEGAGYFQQVRHIVIPLLRPTVTFVLVISSTSAVKIFTETYILIPGAPLTNKSLVSFLYVQAFERFDFGYGSAVGVILFAITLGLSYMNIRMLERGQSV